MTHIERKTINSRIYLYLYQSYRDKNDRIRKKFIKYISLESKYPDLVNNKNKNGIK